MKKITISVAALLIAGMSYGQKYDNSDNQKTKETIQEYNSNLSYQIEDMISAIKMDMYYGYITQDRGSYYINQVYQIKHRHQDLLLDLYKEKAIPFL